MAAPAAPSEPPAPPKPSPPPASPPATTKAPPSAASRWQGLHLAASWGRQEFPSHSALPGRQQAEALHRMMLVMQEQELPEPPSAAGDGAVAQLEARGVGCEGTRGRCFMTLMARSAQLHLLILPLAPRQQRHRRPIAV